MKFTEAIIFDQNVAETGLIFGNVETYRFHCNYRAVSSTDSLKYEVTIDGPTHDAEEFVNWDDGMELNFFTDDSFSVPMSPRSLKVGNRFYFSIDWREEFSDEMPVVYHANKENSKN